MLSHLCLAAQSYQTLCNPMDCSPPGSLVHRDSLGKNIGVGSLSLLQGIFPTQGSSPGLLHCRKILYQLSHQGSPSYISYMNVKLLSRVRLFGTPWTVTYQAPSSMGFSGKNTGVRCHFLLQGIFLTQGSNPGLLHCRWTLYQLSHEGSPGSLAWVAYPFSRGSSQPRDQTQVSCTAGRFFTS